MIRVLVGILGMSVFLSQPLFSQTADEVIDKYFEVTGGRAYWGALENILAEVTRETEKTQIQGQIYRAKPNIFYSNFDFNGTDIIRAFDGNIAWSKRRQKSSFLRVPQKLSAEETQQMERETFLGHLFDYENQGHKAKYIGLAELEGDSLHHVTLTLNTGEFFSYYFDINTGLLRSKAYELLAGPNKGQFIVEYYSDYRKVGVLLMPFKVLMVNLDEKSSYKLNYQSLHINVEFDKSKYLYSGN